MVVQHNLTAMNSNRMLGVTTGSQAKSTEKLSSGYKINRAADDAAGLSISEKMRKQIRGLTQASLNAEDGISAVQTAEGALNEVQDMLQRMNELAVKAANGTMSENDRNYIQDEIKQLETEIDRVAETTKFNETYLLKGDKNADAEYAITYKPGTATITNDVFAKDGTQFTAETLAAALTEDPDTEVYTTAPVTGVEATKGTDYSYDAGTPAKGKAKVDIYYTANAADADGESSTKITAGGSVTGIMNATANGFDTAKHAYVIDDTKTNATVATNKLDGACLVLDTTSGTITEYADQTDITSHAVFNTDGTLKADTLKFVKAATFGTDVEDAAAAVASTASKTAANLYKANGDAIANDGALKTYLDADPTAKVYTTAPVAGVEATEGAAGDYTFTGNKKLYDEHGNAIAANALSNYFETADGTTVTQKANTKVYDENGDEVTMNAAAMADYIGTPEELVGDLTLKLHVGADATDNNQISIDIAAMSAKGLGIKDISVTGKDDTNARAAIDTIKEAIQKVSTQRSALGAVQNRLEHTIANLDNVVENTTAAESQIRDTDMATEMVKYSNNNILAQAGTSMLAQANQANQNVLSLLG